MSDLGGRPTTLTEELHIAIIGAIPYVIIQTQVAAMARMSQQKLSLWLKRGEEELKTDQDTIYTRLFVDFKHTQSKVVSELIEKIKVDPESYRAYAWLLEKCFRSDFGDDSEELKELRELFKQILPLIGKGALDHGREKELDQGSNQAPRSIEEGTARQERGEDTSQEAREGGAL